MQLVIESPALKTSCANSGVMFAFITAGMMFGAKIAHFAMEPGTNTFATKANKKMSKINGINENS